VLSPTRARGGHRFDGLGQVFDRFGGSDGAQRRPELEQVMRRHPVEDAVESGSFEGNVCGIASVGQGANSVFGPVTFQRSTPGGNVDERPRP
jgi:hypothetical protein